MTRVVAAVALSLFAAGCSANASDGGRGVGAHDGPVDGADGGAVGSPSLPDAGIRGPNDPAGTDQPGSAGSVGPATAGPDGAAPEPAISDPAEEDSDLPPFDVCPTNIPATSQIPRLTNREYEAIVRDLLGITVLPNAGSLRPSELLAPDHAGPPTSASWAAYLSTADAIAAAVMSGSNRDRYLACDPAGAGCLQSTIETFGRKIFRRPLTDEEVARMMSFDNLEPKGTPEQVAEAILFAFLSSPSFILLPELSLEVDSATGAFELTSHELATRLALLVWGSAPDDELNAAADADLLRSPEQLAVQAARMVQDRAKTGPQLVNAHRMYAQVHPGSHWGTKDHDSTLFPKFTSKSEVDPAMLGELDAMFEEIGVEGRFQDLFLSNVAFVNQATAPIYGLDAADYGADLVRVELDAMERPGFLTRVAFLSSYSSYAATSPILRGSYVSRNVLAIDPGAPLPTAGQPQPDTDHPTNRAYTEALTAATQCAGCHEPYINPPGFVLEHYDAVGGVQVTDPRGGPIDMVANVLFEEGEQPKRIATPYELMAELVKSAGARGLYAERWVSFATRRVPNEDDACVVDTISERLAHPGYRIRNVMTDLAKPNSFRLRLREN